MKVVGLWSGGKDSCFACYKAKLQGHRIISLINFADSDGTGSVSHGLAADIIRKQTCLIDIPFLQKAMPKKGYREAFKALIEDYKIKEGIEGIVFEFGHNDFRYFDVEVIQQPFDQVMSHWARRINFFDLQGDGIGFENPNPDWQQSIA